MSGLEAVRRSVDGWLTRRRAVVASVASFTAVAVIAATPGSPYHPVLPDDYSDGPLNLLARALFLDHLPHGLLIAIGFVAMVMAGVAFLIVLYACEQRIVPLRTVVVMTLSYAVAILLLPLLLSRDVYSYAYYGRIISEYRGNPFVETPANYPANDLAKLLSFMWRDTPSVYGSVFVWMAAAITAMFHSLTQDVVVFRAIAVGATLGTVWFVYRIMQIIRPDRTTYAIAFIGLNPIVWFHTAGGGHVDALVMLSVAAAIYLLATHRELPATAVLTLGALVKVSAAVPLILLIVYVVARTDRNRRGRVLAAHLGLSIGIAAAASLPFMQSANPTLGMVQLVQHASWIAPPELLERLFQGAGELIAGHPGGVVGIVIARIGMYGALAAGLVLIARQVGRRAKGADLHYLGAAWGWSLLVMMLFSPTLFPWYFCWVLPVAWALPLVPRRTLEIAFLALCTSQLTTENFQLPSWMHINLPIGHPVLVVLLVWFLRDLWRHLRDDVPLDREIPSTTDVVVLPDLDQGDAGIGGSGASSAGGAAG